ncbi:Uncharacterized protein APZ42_033824 [Daphnia magna]|uniref:DDE-1 domain-containing protein n=1 Tax=Daphnia magna TaxID=35525 RepID=A0A164KPU6_9CRUS|nr:Uncharacterized protein APZ42_033824 [Daphnia magna]
MPRNYLRKSINPKPSEESLRCAVTDVLSGRCTIRKAFELYNVRKSTVAFYKSQHTYASVMAATSIKRQDHHLKIFTSKQEGQLVSYLKECCLFNHGLSTKETKKLALSFAIANNLNIPESWKEKEEASSEWLGGFLKRNQSLSIRKPEANSQARAAGFNEPVVQLFYDKLDEVYVKHKFPAHSVWNGDETGNSTVLPPIEVIAPKGMKQVQQTVSAERGENITMLAFVSASGSTIPPIFVFPRKKPNPNLLLGSPATKKNPVSFLMDNHSSHLEFPCVKFAKENSIILLTFPPHCSHKLQPIDVAVYFPFKRALRHSHNEWLQSNPGGIKDIAGLTQVPFVTKIVAENIIAGFKKSGIWPFNRNAIPSSQFTPSRVTDRPDATQHTNTTEDVADEAFAGSSIESNNVNSTIGDDVTLQSIRPFPKVIPSTGSRRPSSRLGSTRILTDSPETNKIEEDYMRKKEKEKKKDANK